MDKIDQILYILIGLVTLHVLGAILRVYAGFYRDGNKLHALIRREINKGNFSDALQICNSHLKKRPYDSQLLWMQAETLYKMNIIEESREKFQYLLTHEPSWRDEAKKYIDAIDSKT